jgi:hypothetical protein
MEPSYEEKAEAQEPARSGARPLGWFGPQRSQKACKQAERPQGGPGQKPQEDPRRQTQCPPSAPWTAQEDLNVVIAMIRARFGYLAIGLGNGGIRYSVPARD